MSDEVIRENRCPDCGRTFRLSYLKSTGKAQQMWQGGCERGSGPGEPYFKKYMPPSDFRSSESGEGQSDG
jgi:hypothetical protein